MVKAHLRRSRRRPKADPSRAAEIDAIDPLGIEFVYQVLLELASPICS